jgi:uncharacterized hydrophobic protein (TIGR00271 family)
MSDQIDSEQSNEKQEQEKQERQRQLSDQILLRRIRMWIRDRFNLHEGKAREEQTVEEISHGVVFRGSNLWILIFAILIASIGLNVNSAAVVIGAMLISPLMGPIMGVGLGVGIYDFELIVKSLRNLLIAVVTSVLTSALYFWISPLSDAQSELLARTNPTLWDVLIGLFGGLAGIVAGSRRDKSNAIPGVAIATALMPPLCTAGYGLATAQWSYFIGAFYLFFINSVFISLSTYLVVRVLRFRRKKFVDSKRERRMRNYIYVFIFLTIIPSIYTAYQVVVDSVFSRSAKNFVDTQFNFDDTYVIDWKSVKTGQDRSIEVTLFGQPLSDEMLADLEAELKNYNLAEADLIVRQSQSDTSRISLEMVEEMNQQMRTGIIEDLYKRNEELLASKDQQIAFLESELVRMQLDQLPTTDIAREAQSINSKVEQLCLSSSILTDFEGNAVDTICLAYVRLSKRARQSELDQLESWLEARTQMSPVKLLVE